MYLFDESLIFSETTYYILINFLSELSINKECFLKCFHFQNDADMFFSVFLDNIEFFYDLYNFAMH